MILYIDGFWANAWDCGPYVALREKGVGFSTAIALLQAGAGLTPAVKRQALTGLAPSLQDGDFWISESLAIIEYIEERFPPPAYSRLFPSDLRQRARARQLMSWLRMEHAALREERSSSLIFYRRSDWPPLGAEAAAQAADLCSLLERLAPSPEGAMFGAWCIADVDLAFAVMRLVCSDYDVPPSVRAYAEAVWRRPSVREYVEHPRPPHAPGNRYAIRGP